MEKKEKVDFILEQMRLCLAKKDYIRCSIISKKVSTRFFEDSSSVVSHSEYYCLSKQKKPVYASAHVLSLPSTCPLNRLLACQAHCFGALRPVCSLYA